MAEAFGGWHCSHTSVPKLQQLHNPQKLRHPRSAAHALAKPEKGFAVLKCERKQKSSMLTIKGHKAERLGKKRKQKGKVGNRSVKPPQNDGATYWLKNRKIIEKL